MKPALRIPWQQLTSPAFQCSLTDWVCGNHGMAAVFLQDCRRSGHSLQEKKKAHLLTLFEGGIVSPCYSLRSPLGSVLMIRGCPESSLRPTAIGALLSSTLSMSQSRTGRNCECLHCCIKTTCSRLQFWVELRPRCYTYTKCYSRPNVTLLLLGVML